MIFQPLKIFSRTKQEIEADYHRRKIVKKFRKRIQKFENSEMDAEMDLKKGILCSTYVVPLFWLIQRWKHF